jgi:hypothetical protein
MVTPRVKSALTRQEEDIEMTETHSLPAEQAVMLTQSLPYVFPPMKLQGFHISRDKKSLLMTNPCRFILPPVCVRSRTGRGERLAHAKSFDSEMQYVRFLFSLLFIFIKILLPFVKNILIGWENILKR